MHEQDCPGEREASATEMVTETMPGEFGHLLRQIENEPVPERLLELALKLQAALVERREAAGTERGPEEA